MDVPPAVTIKSETGKIFDFEPDNSKEIWGASYAVFGCSLPVNNGSRLSETPYLPPSYVGDLYYDMDVSIDLHNMSGDTVHNMKIPTYIREQMMFKGVEDNDPPQVMVEILKNIYSGKWLL